MVIGRLNRLRMTTFFFLIAKGAYFAFRSQDSEASELSLPVSQLLCFRRSSRLSCTNIEKR